MNTLPCWAPWWVVSPATELIFFFMGNNKFSSSDRPPKRSRTDVTNQFFKQATENFPRFHVVQSQQAPMGTLSPFVIGKALKKCIGDKYKAKMMRTGDLLVEVNTKEQCQKLTSLNKIQELDVTVTPHRTLNFAKGVISETELLQSTNEEIEVELAEQGVVAARRIMMRKEGKEIKTKHVVLTFNTTKLPDAVNAEYLHCKVHPYIPNPRRCFQCQRYGHGSQSCRGKPTCARCGQKEHNNEKCERDPQCVNCEGAHGAYSRSCPVWKREKEIITLKTKENIPYPEARKRIAFQEKGTFAEVAKRGPQPPGVSVGTQVELQDLVSAVRPHPLSEQPVAQPTGRKISREHHTVFVDASSQEPKRDSPASISEEARAARPSNQKEVLSGRGAPADAAASQQRAGSFPASRRIPKGRGKSVVAPRDTTNTEDSRSATEEDMDLCHSDSETVSNPDSLSRIKNTGKTKGTG